jgi:PGF-pre-PGF domain-containing protein
MFKTTLLLATTLALFFCVYSSAASAEVFMLRPTGGVVELGITDRTFAVEKVYLSLPDQKDEFKIIVESREPDVELVYKYYWINATGLVKGPNWVLLDIRVPISWLRSKNISIESVRFSVYDGTWKSLPLAPLSADDDYYRYRTQAPMLNTVFALTGEPMPVNIVISTVCNENDICEPDIGEDNENCPDCLRRFPGSVCIPGGRSCVGGDLMICSDYGTGYRLQRCDHGCSGDACLLSPPGLPTGMFVAADPVFISVVTILAVIIIYLAFSIRKTKEKLERAESRKQSNEELKAISLEK